MTVVLGNGDGTFGASISYPTAIYPFGKMAVGDFDKNGNLDVIGGSGADVGIIFGASNGSFGAMTTIAVALPQTAANVTAGDIDGDGNIDFVVNDLVGNAKIAWGHGTGGFTVDPIFGAFGGIFQVADLDGDGLKEIIKSQNASTNVPIAFQTSARTFAAPVTYTGTGEADDIAVADFNNDGYQDLLLGSQTVTYLPGLANGTFGAAVTLDTYGFRGDLKVFDANSDGALDILFTPIFSTASSLYLQDTTQAAVSPYQDYLDLSTAMGARTALPSLDAQRERISESIAKIGAQQSRLGVLLSQTQGAQVQYEAAYSRIVDADVAAESSQLVSNSILRQIGSAILAQANLNPRIALELLKG